jgi:formate hydrogenlyase subunit 3/multisubunit Na+/H+ antiporter MnhD subunit
VNKKTTCARLPKGHFFTGAFQKVQSDPFGLVLVVAAVLSTLITLIYTFLAGIRIFFGPLKSNPGDHPINDPPLTMSIPLFVLALIAFALGLFPQPVLKLLSTALISL